jgi:hypothetical protein
MHTHHSKALYFVGCSTDCIIKIEKGRRTGVRGSMWPRSVKKSMWPRGEPLIRAWGMQKLCASAATSELCARWAAWASVGAAENSLGLRYLVPRVLNNLFSTRPNLSPSAPFLRTRRTFDFFQYVRVFSSGSRRSGQPCRCRFSQRSDEVGSCGNWSATYIVSLRLLFCTDRHLQS